MAKALLNKIAVVTGANSGMGFATCRALLDEGATVIMLYSSKRSKDMELAKRLYEFSEELVSEK